MKTKKPYEKNKEQKTPEEKEAILTQAVEFFKGLVRNKVQGNVSFPLYEGIVGKAKLDLYVDPGDAKEIFRIGGQ